MAYASWYHWNCGQTQRKAATINQLACPSYSCSGTQCTTPERWRLRYVLCRSKPYSILTPTQDSKPGHQIHERWPLPYHCTLNLLSTHNRIRTLMDYLLCHHPTTNPQWHLGGMEGSCNSQHKLCLGWVQGVISYPGTLWCIIPHKGNLHNVTWCNWYYLMARPSR